MSLRRGLAPESGREVMIAAWMLIHGVATAGRSVVVCALTGRGNDMDHLEHESPRISVGCGWRDESVPFKALDASGRDCCWRGVNERGPSTSV